MKKLLSAATLTAALLLTAGPAVATDTGDHPHRDCHGRTETECRDDPHPDHGRDCEHSDDHRCPTTTTSSSTTTTLLPPLPLPTPTTIAPASTTTTTVPAPTVAVPVTTTTTTPVTPPTVMGVTIESHPTLPKTGGGPGWLLAAATGAIGLGTAALTAGHRRHG